MIQLQFRKLISCYNLTTEKKVISKTRWNKRLPLFSFRTKSGTFTALTPSITITLLFLPNFRLILSDIAVTRFKRKKQFLLYNSGTGHDDSNSACFVFCIIYYYIERLTPTGPRALRKILHGFCESYIDPSRTAANRIYVQIPRALRVHSNPRYKINTPNIGA